MKKILTGVSGNAELVGGGFMLRQAMAGLKVLGDPKTASSGIGGTSVDLALGFRRQSGTHCRTLITVGVNDDWARRELSRILTDQGVDHHLLPVRTMTSFALVLNPVDAELAPIGFKFPYTRMPIDEVREQTLEFAPDVVIASGVVPDDMPLIEVMFTHAPEGCMRVLNPRSELIAASGCVNVLLLTTNLLMLNSLEVAQLLGQQSWCRGDDLSAIHHQWGVDEVIVTCGSDGAVYSKSDGTNKYQAAIDCGKVCDKTGAGDSFQVGFLASRLEGNSTDVALRCGATSAGITVTRNHGSSIPTRDEVEALMAR